MMKTDELQLEGRGQRSHREFDGAAEDGTAAPVVEAQPVLEARAAPTQSVGQTHIRLEFGFPKEDGPGIVDRIIRTLLGAKAKMSLHPPATDGSFIERYTRWADVTEAPRLMHTVVAVQLVASLLNRNGVTFKLGSITSPLDLWVLLL